MKQFYLFLSFILMFSANALQAQNDSIYFWKNGTLKLKESIKPADLDSITFKRDNNGTVNNSDKSVLFDKWWYDSNNFAADLHFHSNGNYEQMLLLGTQGTQGTGKWTWIDQNNGIMKIDNLTGNAQVLPYMWLKFSDIKSNSFTIQQSANGTDYSVKLFYKDTNN